MSNDDYNYVAEACTELLRGKDVGFSMNGYVTTEEQWKAAYKEQIGKTEDNIAIMSSDPTEWQITWTQVQAEVEKLKIELLNLLLKKRDVKNYQIFFLDQLQLRYLKMQLLLLR